MREVYIAPAKRIFKVSEATWLKLAVLKVFWPPDHKIEIGKAKKRIVKMEDIYPWPPPEQSLLIDVQATGNTYRKVISTKPLA